MKGFKLDKCQRRCESRDDGQNGCRYRDSERERPIRSLRHYSSPSSPNSGIRNNPEQGRLYGDEASLAASGHAQESAFERKSRPDPYSRQSRCLPPDPSVRRVPQCRVECGRNHIWADRYDGELADVFALQDEITKKAVAAIEPSLPPCGWRTTKHAAVLR